MTVVMVNLQSQVFCFLLSERHAGFTQAMLIDQMVSLATPARSQQEVVRKDRPTLDPEWQALDSDFQAVKRR